MDGDGPAIADLKDAISRDTWTYVDEAHAFGLYPGGGSRLSAANLRPHAQVLAFGKALGIAGAAFTGSHTTCQWVRTRARSFVFSTGMSPRLAEEIDASLDRLLSDEGEQARERLWANRDLLANELRVPAPQAPIFPLVLGDPRRAVEVSNQLLERGFHVQAIRPPTVPEGGSRLRLTLSAAHTPEQIRRLAQALRDLLPTVELSPSPARTLSTAKVS
jgi:7-keto-8-aminopelargonate synthetase-like enzyme